MTITLSIELSAAYQKGVASVTLNEEESKNEESIKKADGFIIGQAKALLNKSIEIVGEINKSLSQPTTTTQQTSTYKKPYNNTYKKTYTSNGTGTVSEKQLKYIESLGYTGEAPRTSAEASKIIETLKANKTQPVPTAPQQEKAIETSEKLNNSFSGFDGFDNISF